MILENNKVWKPFFSQMEIYKSYTCETGQLCSIHFLNSPDSWHRLILDKIAKLKHLVYPPKIIISPDWQKSIIKFPIQETIIQNYVFPLRNEFQKRKFLWKKDHPGFSKEKIPKYTFVHIRKWFWEDFLCVIYNKVLCVWFLRIHALYIQVIWFISSGKAGKTTSVCFIKSFPVPR